jgi:hypothetical protein
MANDCKPRLFPSECSELVPEPPIDCCPDDGVERGWYSQRLVLGCEEGFVWPTVIVPYARFYSTVSQEAADAAALEYGTAQLECQQIWYSEEQTAYCPEGFSGDPVIVPAGQFSSLVSQEDANLQAYNFGVSQLTCTGGGYVFYEDFAPSYPDLPTGWTIETTELARPWEVSSLGMFHAEAFTIVETVAETSLITPSILIPAGDAAIQLTIMHSYNTETNYDYCHLDISLNDDVFVTEYWVLSGPSHWTGDSPIATDVLTLSNSLAGNSVRFRFRLSNDSSGSPVGPNWSIYNVGVSVIT